MSEKEIMELMELLQKAMKKEGRKIDTAVLYDGDTQKMIVDNRREEDLN